MQFSKKIDFVFNPFMYKMRLRRKKMVYTDRMEHLYCHVPFECIDSCHKINYINKNNGYNQFPKIHLKKCFLNHNKSFENLNDKGFHNSAINVLLDEFV